MENIKNSIRKQSNINSLILIAFEILIIPTALLTEIIPSWFFSKESESYKILATFLGFLLQYLICGCIPLLVFYLTKRGRTVSKSMPLFRKPKKSWKWIFKFILISLGLIYASQMIANVFFNLIEKVFGIDLTAVDFTVDNTLLSQITNVTAIMFFAPFFEELIFRGTIARNGSEHCKTAIIIASGIFFGLWHVNYAQTIFASVMGICAAFLFFKTESIIPSMLLHLSLNTIGAAGNVLAGYIDISKFAEDPESVEKIIEEQPAPFAIYIILTLVTLGLMITGIIFFANEISKNPKEFTFENSTPGLSEGKKLGIYMTAPVTIIAVLLLVTFTVLRAVDMYPLKYIVEALL